MAWPNSRNGGFVAAAAVSLMACWGLTEPGGGGQITDPRRCSIGSTSRWRDNGLILQVSQPPCPFTISESYPGQRRIDYVAVVTAPSNNITFDVYGRPESYINTFAIDWYTGYQIATAAFVYFQQDPGDQSTYRSEPRMSGTPGFYRNPNYFSEMLDSLHADAVFMRIGGFSWGWKILPGNNTFGAPNLLGPPGVMAGYTNTWRNQPHFDTTAYTYRWVLDGQEISNARGAQYQTAFPFAGTYRLGSVAIRSDDTRDTVTMTVTVYLPVTVTGPSRVAEWEWAQWNGYVSGGYPPYQYQWYVDYEPAGNDTYLGRAFGPHSTYHRIELAVTDSHGNTGQAALDVYVYDPNCPDCAPYSRNPPTAPLAPKP